VGGAGGGGRGGAAGGGDRGGGRGGGRLPRHLRQRRLRGRHGVPRPRGARAQLVSTPNLPLGSLLLRFPLLAVQENAACLVPRASGSHEPPLVRVRVWDFDEHRCSAALFGFQCPCSTDHHTFVLDPRFFSSIDACRHDTCSKGRNG